MTMRKSAAGRSGGCTMLRGSKYIVAKGQRDDDAFINSDDEKYSNY